MPAGREAWKLTQATPRNVEDQEPSKRPSSLWKFQSGPYLIVLWLESLRPRNEPAQILQVLRVMLGRLGPEDVQEARSSTRVGPEAVVLECEQRLGRLCDPENIPHEVEK